MKHLLAAAAAGLALAGCAQSGDFGRGKRTALNDEVLPAIGAEIARQREEPVSDFPLNDEEREMRDAAWGLIIPNPQAGEVERMKAELRRTRILSPAAAQLRREAYFEGLISTRYSSSRARYAKLAGDIEADRARIGPFFARAQRVAELDRIRLASLSYVATTAAEQANAKARVAENGGFINWVHESLRSRAASYRYALERLVLETPGQEAVMAERSLKAFEADIATLGPLGQRWPTKG